MCVCVCYWSLPCCPTCCGCQDPEGSCWVCAGSASCRPDAWWRWPCGTAGLPTKCTPCPQDGRPQGVPPPAGRPARLACLLWLLLPHSHGNAAHSHVCQCRVALASQSGTVCWVIVITGPLLVSFVLVLPPPPVPHLPLNFVWKTLGSPRPSPALQHLSGWWSWGEHVHLAPVLGSLLSSELWRAGVCLSPVNTSGRVWLIINRCQCLSSFPRGHQEEVSAFCRLVDLALSICFSGLLTKIVTLVKACCPLVPTPHHEGRGPGAR